jgi:hypothetical protein
MKIARSVTDNLCIYRVIWHSNRNHDSVDLAADAQNNSGYHPNQRVANTSK